MLIRSRIKSIPPTIIAPIAAIFLVTVVTSLSEAISIEYKRSFSYNARSEVKKDMTTVRTRIAPSPTGFPHIGTIYQALFDFAYAKKHKGAFFVRIEDT